MLDALIPNIKVQAGNGSRFHLTSQKKAPPKQPVDTFVRFGGGDPIQQPFIIDNPPAIDLNNMAPYEKLIAAAKSFALPQVSGYQVGEIAIGASGKAYLGVNIEIKGGDYSDSIHGEQFLYALARKHGETGIRQMVISAEPCGHCRQFMMEGGDANAQIIHQVSQTGKEGFSGMVASSRWNQTTLGELTPGPFILATAETNMFNSKPYHIVPLPKNLNSLEHQAVEAAKTSYTPLSQETWAGIAVRLKDGSVYTGSVIESAAYNPTLPPLQDAIVGIVSNHKRLEDISEVVLAEPALPNFSYAQRTKSALRNLAPKARFKVIKARKLD